jgi:hypothetical protein
VHSEELKLTPRRDGILTFTPFINLPSRQLTDYYQLIKNPRSLKAVQKSINGQRGRDAATGQTLFKSWDALAEDMSLIWQNARLYNEDGSEIYELAGELEVSLFQMSRP